MVSLKKYIPCKCGANNSFDFNSDMQIEDITVSARCSTCGASIAISVSSLLATPAPTPAPSVSLPAAEPSAGTALAEAHDEAETKSNVEQAVRDLFR